MGRKCAYCDAKDVPLEVEHIHPKVRRGSERISNLTIACHECNQAKGIQSIDAFLSQDTERFNRIKSQLQTLDGQHLPSAFPIHSQRYEHRPTANDPFFAHLLIASV
jgi:5-methylcytosine-specific restriction endonuclease McrA